MFNKTPNWPPSSTEGIFNEILNPSVNDEILLSFTVVYHNAAHWSGSQVDPDPLTFIWYTPSGRIGIEPTARHALSL